MKTTRDTNFIKVKLEAVIAFAGPAYLPTEFSYTHLFIQEGMRALGLLKKGAGRIPVWVQDGRFQMGMIPPPKKPHTPSLEKLQECEKRLLEEVKKASSMDGASSKEKRTSARSRPKKKRSKTRVSTAGKKKPS